MEFVIVQSISEKVDISNRKKISFFTGDDVVVLTKSGNFFDGRIRINPESVLVDATNLFCRFVNVKTKGDIQLFTRDAVLIDGSYVNVYTPRWNLSELYNFLECNIHFYCLRSDVSPKIDMLGKKSQINT